MARNNGNEPILTEKEIDKLYSLEVELVGSNVMEELELRGI
ncbi:MAG TPA: hypothetical protein VJ461_00800 [Candidatus Nanoarchaeia archaeon]|nr:hypothetical protein [Candidatus Nanoarchaeia archaeon]